MLWELVERKSYFQVGVLKFKDGLKIFINGGYTFKNGAYGIGLKDVSTTAFCILGYNELLNTELTLSLLI